MKQLNGHLIFAPPQDSVGQYMAVLAGAKVADHGGVSWLAVPHSLGNTVILNNMGIDAPSPIEREYDFPGPFRPYPQQVKVADFLAKNKRCFNLSDMGTGKTAAALWAADYLMKKGVVHKALIACTKSTTEFVWGEEIFNLFGPANRSYAKLLGPATKRFDLLAQPHPFYIINHDGVKIADMAKAIAQRPDINLLIIDEIAEFKEAKTSKWKALKKIAEVADMWVWGLTGGPTPNAPTDAHAQIRMIRQGRYPINFSSFRDQTMMQVNPSGPTGSWGKWVPRAGAEQYVVDHMTPAIRFTLKECDDSIPPTIYHDRHCDLTPAQNKLHKELKKEAAVIMESGVVVNAVNAAVLVSKVCQIACGVVYGTDKEEVQVDCAPRLKLLDEVVSGAGGKCIVFAPFTCTIAMLKKHLSKDYTVAVIQGGVSDTRRTMIMKEFQNSPDPKILIAHPDTMAHGVTLTAANTTIWYGPPNKNKTYEQANARTPRPGQTKVTNIIHISSSPTERAIYQRLKEKGALHSVVLELAKNK